MKEYIEAVKCNVAMVGYRGYSDSEGEPTEEGLKIDSKAIINFLSNLDSLQNSPLIIHGRSLGGAVAIHSLDSETQ